MFLREAMINVQDFIKNSTLFKKFEVDELLFVEIICPAEEGPPTNLWWHDNFFSYAMAGEMVLKTLQGEYHFKAGECIFVKKGSIISSNHIIQTDFCELRVFIPDDFIKSIHQKYRISPSAAGPGAKTDTIIPLITDETLRAYFHSLLTYFHQPTPPSGTLLKLKFEELVVSILSGTGHTLLQSFLGDICRSASPSIKEVMEANFFSNLSLAEFARLSSRSLSAFKQEFRNIFQTTPAKWLQEKRLDYSLYLLEHTTFNVDEVCTVAGFENRSHFIRVFKGKFGVTPGKFSMEKHHLA